MAGNLDFLLDTGDRFFEAQGQIIPQVFSSRLSSTPSPAAAEKFAKDVPKDVLKTGIEIESASKGPIIAESCMTILIVLRPLLWVRQHLVSFRNLLKIFFRLFVAGIAVGMILKSKLSVRLLDLVITGIATDAQQLVIVVFAVQAVPRFANILYT